MYPGEIIGIILGVLMVLIVSHCLIAEVFEQSFYTPKSIYEESSMNWLGTIVIYILIFPFTFVLAIGGFLKWIFTVGRK